MHAKLSHQDATRLAAMVTGFVLAGAFGIILIATGDWLPGGIIVAAAIAGLAAQIPVVRKLRREGSTPSPPGGKTA